MAKRYIKQFITQQLGQFFENLDSATDIQFSMSEAILQLEQVTIREDALTKLKLPVQIKHGRVRKLDVRVPWRTISSSPVQITFDGIDLLLTPQGSEGWQFTDIYSEEYLQTLLASLVQQILTEQATEAQQSWLDSIKLKVMDNIQVQITEIHVRMEHFIPSEGSREPKQSASFGILLRSFDIHTTDKDGKEIFHDRALTKTNIYKRVQLKGLAFYLNPVDENMIHKVSRHLLSQPAQVSQRMREIIKQYVELTDCPEEDQHKVVDDPNLIYILRPLSLKVVVQNRTEKPEKLRIDITLTRFSLQFLYNQLKSILVFGKLAQQYRLKGSEQEKSRKYRFLKKPDMRARERWKFAIECIWRSIRTKNGALTAFTIPEKKLVEYKNYFKSQFVGYYNTADAQRAKYFTKLTPQNRQQFFYILSVLQPHQIKAWAKEIVSQVEKDKKETQEAKAQQSWGSWLMGYSAQKKQDDEEDNLDKFFGISEAEKMEEADSISRRERTSLEVIFEVKELTMLLAKINVQNKLDGIQMYNKGATIYLNGPTMNLDEFVLEVAFQESGVNLVTIDRQSGQYQDCTSAIQQNKSFSSQFEKSRPQCSIEVKKGTKELLACGIEYDINIRIESIIYKHYEDLIIRARAISNVKIDEEMQAAAIGRLEDLRETTQNRMHQLLYKTKNRYVISVESPILILPICATFEGRVAPCWVINTGNLLVLSEDLDKNKKNQSIAQLLHSQDEDRYDGYKVTISSIGMTYYDSFHEYERMSKMDTNKPPIVVYAGNDLPQMPARFHEFTAEQNRFLAENPQRPEGTKKFQVLEDFEIRMLIKVLISSRGSVAAQMIADVNTTPIQINFCVTTYNLLQNINYIFQISKLKQKEFTQEVDTYQLRVKQEIIEKTILQGPIRRLNQTTLFWEDQYAVLSGRFFYLYESQASKTHLEYIEILEAEMVSQQGYFSINYLGIRYTIMPKDGAKWEEVIRKQILSLQVQDLEQQSDIEQQVNRRKQGLLKKAQNPHQPASVMTFNVPSLKLQLKRLKVDEASQQVVEPAFFENWVTIAFMGMRMEQRTREFDSEKIVKFQEITLSDCTMPLIHQTLISQNIKNNEFSLEITMRSVKEGSPDYTGLLQDVGVTLKDVNFKFMPVSINTLIKFLRYLKYKPDADPLFKSEEFHNRNIFGFADNSSPDNKLLAEIEPLQLARSTSDQVELTVEAQQQQQKFYESDCSHEKVHKSRYRFNATNMKMSLLHHKYTMELYRMDAESMAVEMSEWYDHAMFSTAMKQLRLYDVTNYPYTVSPRAYFDQVSRGIQPEKRAQNEMIRCNDFDFVYNSYYSNKCALKNPVFANKLKMRASPFRINYVQEVTMRFNEYFQQQFIDSLTMTDPYTNPREEFEARQRRKGIPLDRISQQTDFGQEPTVNQMDIKISKAEIFARDRPFSQNYILISSPQITVSSERVESRGRLLKHPDIVLGMQRYNIELKTINFWYGISKKRSDRLSLLKDTFTVKIAQDYLLQSEILQRIDFQQLENFQDIKITFDPLMLVLPQAVYTYFLRCNDLNFGWTDQLTSEFYCVKWIHMDEYYKNLKKVKSQVITMEMPLLSLTLKHTDGNYISELFLRQFSYSMTRFMDRASNQNILCSEFYILDDKIKNRSDKQQAIVCPWDSKLEVLSKELQNKKDVFVGEPQLSVSFKMKANGEKKIVTNITGLKIFLKMPLFVMVMGYFNNAWPKYNADDIDKPLGFVGNDPDNTSRMIMSLRIHKSLICFLNRPGFKSIACQGEILFETMSENINRMKKCHSSLGGARHEFGERTMSLISDDQQYSDTVYSMKIQVSQFVPYICSLGRLETGENDFSQISKRQLFSPLDLSMCQTYQLKPCSTNTDDNEETKWGVTTSTKFEIGKLQLEISILDLHLILQVISYIADLYVIETVSRLQAIEKSIDQEFMKRMDDEEILKSNEDLLSAQQHQQPGATMAETQQSRLAKKKFFNRLIAQLEEEHVQDNMSSILNRLGHASAQFKRLTDGYTGQSFSQRETFLQFVKKDILQTDGDNQVEDATVEDYEVTEPQKPDENRTVALLQGVDSDDDKDAPLSEDDTAQFHDVKNKESYNQLMNSERRKLSAAFTRIKLTSGGQKASVDTSNQLRQSQRKTITVGSQGSKSRNSANSGDDSDEFKSLDGQSIESYQRDVRSAYEDVFYSFHGKSRPIDNQASATNSQVPDLYEESNSKHHNKISNIERVEEEESPEREEAAGGSDNDDKGSFDPSIDDENDLGVKQPKRVVQEKAEAEVVTIQPTIQNILEDNKDIQCEQISILAINDYNSGFTPVLMLDLQDISMTQTWKCSKAGTMSLCLPEMLINYYNLELGEWEPLLEPTKMELQQTSNEISQQTNVVFEKPLNLNSTEECLQNLYFTYESWMQTPQYFNQSNAGAGDKRLPEELHKSADILTNQDALAEVEEVEEHEFMVKQRHFKNDKVFMQQMRESIINKGGFMQQAQQHVMGSSDEIELAEEKKPQPNTQGNNQTLVTPYSIANYTPRQIKIVRNGIQQGTFNSVRTFKKQIKDRTGNQSIYILEPSSQTDYAVTQERLTDQVKEDNSKRRQNPDESVNLTINIHQNELSYMTESHRSYNRGEDLQDQTKLKHQEIIGIQFSEMDYAPKVDLNRNTGQNPWVHQITRKQSSRLASHLIFSNDMDNQEPLLQDHHDQPQAEINLEQLTNKVFYGTLLKGMRKFLIIRAPYCFRNNTSYAYELRICDDKNQRICYQTLLPVQEFCGLDDEYFTGHSVQLRMIKKANAEQTLAEWSQSVLISDLVMLPLNEGTGHFVTDNQVNSVTTCIKRQSGEINGTNDLVLLPPLTIKNCLPCSLAIRKHNLRSVNERVSTMNTESTTANDRIVEQSQEIQFHVFELTKLAPNQDGYSLEIGVDGFVFAKLELKLQDDATTIESDFELHDEHKNTLKIGLRQSFSKAGFHLILYAHVCLLVEAERALKLMQIFYKGGLSQGRRLLANSNELQSKRYILCNKDTDIVVGMKDSSQVVRATSFSQNLDLSEPGKQTHFVVRSQPQPQQHQEGQLNHRRYDFVCTPSLQLASYEDRVYTKLVQITPEYLICNHTRTSIEIGQDGHQQNDGLNRVIEPGQRREWYWNVGNLPDVNLRIVMRKVPPKPQEIVAMRTSAEMIEPVSSPTSRLSQSDKVSEWNWSRPISLYLIKDQSSFPLLICERQGSRKKVFVLSKKVVGPIQFIIIKEENRESVQPCYVIRNNCPNLQLSFQQDGVVMPDPWKLGELSSMVYAHMDPQARDTAVTFNLKVDKSSKRWNFRTQNCFERQIQSVSMDNEWQQSFTYFDDQKCEQTIQVQLSDNGITRTLTFEMLGYEPRQHKPKKIQSKEGKEKATDVTETSLKSTVLSVVVHSMSLSMIGYTNTSLNQQGFKKYQTRRERNEIALFTISGLKYIQKDDLKENQQQINLEIVRFQIDNQSSQNPLFHTVLAKKDNTANSAPFLYFVVNQKTKQDAAIQVIDFFELQMADQVVKLDDAFLTNVIQTVSQALALSQSNQTQMHPLFMIDNFYAKAGYLDRLFNPSQLAIADLEQNRHSATVDLQEALKSQRRRNMTRLMHQGIVTVSEVYFEQKIENVSPIFCHWVMQEQVLADSKKLELRDFKINRVMLEFTFIFRTKHRRNQVNEGYLQYVQSSGFKLASVDELQLKFNEFQIQNRIIPQDALTQQLNQFYIASIWSQIIESLFTIKALGNLTGFVGHVVDGCYDLVEMPRSGFQQSWYQGVGGIFLGFGSFLQKSGIGFFGSIEVFTESWSEIALAIGLDKDYAIMHEENVITERPKNFVEGLGFGARSFLQSIPAALVGFFSRPVVEANKAGWLGLASGLYQGAVGIICKPISGSLDLCAKTAEGVKNTLRIMEMKQKRGRVRMPRTFYGLQRRIKAFSEDDAFIVSNVLCQIKRGEFAQDHYIDMKLIWTSNDKNSPHFLLLSEENLFLIEASQKALVWHIESKHINKWTNMSNGMLISLDETKDYAGRAQVGLPLDTQSSQEINYWFEQVVQLKENF